MKKSPVFVTMLPGAKNVHLIKDVGMIPFVMHRHYGFDATLAAYLDGDYPHAAATVKGLKLGKIRRLTGNEILDGVAYLIPRARRIDVLNLFHFSKQSLIFILVYKCLNPRGKAYLKLDMNESVKKSKPSGSIGARLKRSILGLCACVSVETTDVCDYLCRSWGIKVSYLPNGFYDFDHQRAVEYGDKGNVICTVGRIGAAEKATGDLLEAFRLASPHLAGWKLRLVGPVGHGFSGHLDEFFARYPELKPKIELVGEISDRTLLDREYARAKIFCLTSRAESFGLVLVEALKNGCFVISSNVPAALDITDNQKYGEIYPKGDVDRLAKLLESNCNDDAKLAGLCDGSQQFAYSHFDWVKICGDLAAKLAMV